MGSACQQNRGSTSTERGWPRCDWLGRVSTLGQPNAAWAGDRGDPDDAVRAALAAAAVGRTTDDYLSAVAALCAARLLLPIVADGDEAGDGPDPTRHAEMAAVLMTSATGQTGALAFTGLDALLAFDAHARPVPCTLDVVAATAIEVGAQAIVVDVAGPHQLVIDESLIGPLATGNRLIVLTDGWGWLSAGAPA